MKITSKKYFLDKNENYFPHSPSLIATIKRTSNIKSVGKYPQAFNQDLYQALSQFHTISLESLFIANGLEDVLHISWLSLKQYLNLEYIVLPQIHWSNYDNLSYKCGFESSNLITYPTEPPTLESNLTDFTKTVAKLSGPSLIVITNPNNPTSQELDCSLFEAIIAKYPQHIFYFDEAYIGFGKENIVNSMSIGFTKRYSNVIVGRSFSKFFLCPGIRLGYLITSPELLLRLRLTPTYLGINNISQTIGINLLKDYVFYQKQSEIIKRTRDRFIKDITDISELTPHPSSTNFVTIRINESVKIELLQICLENKGFYVKYLTNLFDNNYIRITVAPQIVMDEIYLSLQQFFKEK